MKKVRASQIRESLRLNRVRLEAGEEPCRIDMTGLDLRGFDFTGTRCEGVTFWNSDLRGAKFTTELLQAESLWHVICDDEQLPWLIGHPQFQRRDASGIWNWE